MQARVAKALAEAQAQQAEDEHTLEVTTKDLSILEEQEQDLRKEVERIEGKREWMEEFRGWIEMLGSFLEEKVTDYREYANGADTKVGRHRSGLFASPQGAF